MNKKITASTSSTRVDLKIRNKQGKEVVWASTNAPRYVVSLTHTINGGGRANDLSLSIYHHLDPYAEEPRFGYGVYEDRFGFKANEPSYLMRLLAEGFGEIYVRYGYVHEENIVTAFSNTSESGLSPWYKMYLTGVSSHFGTNGITYEITAVSTLVYSANLMGGIAYDWWTDPENRYATVYGTDSFIYNSIKNSKSRNKITVGLEEETWNRIKGIIYYIAKIGGYEADLSAAAYGSRTVANFSSISVFTQTAQQPDILFINNLLSNVIIVARQLEPRNYTDESGNTKTVSACYAWKRAWTIILDDSVGVNKKPILRIDYAYTDYTINDVRDLMNRDVSALSFDERQKYKVFQVEVNNTGNSIGSLFYNFSTFDRDMFSEKPLVLKSDNLFSSESEYMKPKNVDSYYVSADIIDLKLDSPIIAGLAGAQAEMYPNSNVSENGVVVNTVVYGQETANVYHSTSIFNSVFNNIGSNDFKRILSRLYAQGTVTIPGIARAVSMLSPVNIFVYISNKLDVTSGQYTIIDQVDTISGGQYQTSFNILKSKSFDSSDVYELVATPKVASEQLASSYGNQDITYANDFSVTGNTSGILSAKRNVKFSLNVSLAAGSTQTYGNTNVFVAGYKNSSNDLKIWFRRYSHSWIKDNETGIVSQNITIEPFEDIIVNAEDTYHLGLRIQTGPDTYTPEKRISYRVS